MASLLVPLTYNLLNKTLNLFINSVYAKLYGPLQDHSYPLQSRYIKARADAPCLMFMHFSVYMHVWVHVLCDYVCVHVYVKTSDANFHRYTV